MIVTRVFKDFIALVLVFVGDQKHLQFEEFFDFFYSSIHLKFKFYFYQFYLLISFVIKKKCNLIV